VTGDLLSRVSMRRKTTSCSAMSSASAAVSASACEAEHHGLAETI